MKYKPATVFSSGTEYEIFRYNFCDRCKFHKMSPDGAFIEFTKNGGCPIENDIESCHVGAVEFPKEIMEIYHNGKRICSHYCPFFTEKERDREMIDETKLIEKIKARKEYLQRQAARYDKARDVKRMDMCDQAKFELDTVLMWIDFLRKETKK